MKPSSEELRAMESAGGELKLMGVIRGKVGRRRDLGTFSFWFLRSVFYRFAKRKRFAGSSSVVLEPGAR